MSKFSPHSINLPGGSHLLSPNPQTVGGEGGEKSPEIQQVLLLQMEKGEPGVTTWLPVAADLGR